MKIVTLALSVGLVACGKTVTYDGGVPKNKVPGQVHCLTSCEELGGNTQNSLVDLKFSVPYVSHNQLMCESVKLHGSLGKTFVGCNDGTGTPVTVTSKLRNPGDCQRVTFYTDVPNPGSFNSHQHPGHYEVCEQSGPQIWIDVEDHVGFEDFNDSQMFVTAVNGETLEWKYDDDKLFICLPE